MSVRIQHSPNPIYRWFLAVFTTLLAVSGSAQSTKVYGTVFDGETGEPLPFVNIAFWDSKIGTQTDMQGNYELDSYYATDSLVASYIGYVKVTKPIEKDIEQNVDFALFSTEFQLDEVVVTVSKEEDPAIAIMRRVIDNRDINNREKLESYQYEAYNKVQFDLNNITDKFEDKKLFKQFDFIFDYVDTTSNDKDFLPIFMTESLSDYYFRKNPKSNKEIIKATKVSGFQQDNISEFLGSMYQNVNVYDNFPLVFNKAFISPVSTVSLQYYNFYLEDSAYIDNEYWCYKLSFFPKRKQELTFIGEMWIHDTTYAIKEISCDIAEDANINYVKDAYLVQSFEQVEHEVWMLVYDEFVIDFEVAKKAQGIYGRKFTSYRDYVINEPMDDEFYEGGENIILADENVNNKSDEFWDEHRHDSLSANQQTIYFLMDTLDKVPIIHTYIDIITTLFTGYKVLGNFEIGPYFNLYSYNPVEGHRFRIGGRTSNAFSTRLEFSGYVAYGLTDERFKYGGGFRYMFSKRPRQMIAAYYSLDVEQLGQSADAFSQDNILSSFFRRNPAWKLTQVEQYKLIYEYEWFQGLSNQILLRHRTLTPLGDLQYQYFGEAGDIQTLDNITTAEATLYTRFAYNEKFVAGEFNRVSLGTKSPTLEMQYTYGVKGFFDSQYEYHRLKFSIEDKIFLGPLGHLKIYGEAGKIWGQLPYPLLELHQGNETYYYYESAFNTMNFFEFVSDEWVSGSAEWHLGGIFLNKIPLLRKLKWREVGGIKAVYGHLSDKHLNELILDPGMHSLQAKPFAEAAVGIENIFKILRVDALFRLTYRDHPNIQNFGIRAKLHIDF